MQTAQTTSKEAVPIIRGDKYRRTHKASVIGILGAHAPAVCSRGSQFFNADRWTARFLTKALCVWAGANPGCVPTGVDLEQWIRSANTHRAPKAQIVIANTPDKLPLRTALGLTGGAYHEAFHTKYSCRRILRADEVSSLVLPRWAKVKDWSKYYGAFQQWSNVIEDIRIERRGREDYDGVYVKLCDLQDFILLQEQQGALDVRAHGGKSGALSVIIGVFRDVGLGYNTETQRFVMAQYQKDNPKAVEMVLNGPLAPMLRETIGMSRDDDLGCLRVAMDVIAELAELGKGADEDEQAQQGQTGDGNQECPACSAPANKIKVRPKSDGNGGKVKGVGIATCTVCGFQEEVEVEPKQQQQPGQGSGQDGPDFDGFDDMDFDSPAGDADSDGDESDGDDQSGDSKADGQDDSNQTGGSGKGADKGDDENDGAGGGDTGKEGDDGDSDSGGKGAKDDGKDKDGDSDSSGKGAKDDGKDKDSDSGDKGAEQGDKNDGGTGDPSDGGNKQGDETDGGSDSGGCPGSAGGHHHDKKDHPGDDWTDVAEDALDQAADGKDLGLKDGNSALEDAFDAVREKDNSDIGEGEAPWNPYDPDMDEAHLVQPSAKGKAHDGEAADRIIRSVKRETAFLRARLRTVIKSIEMSHTVHGVPKGRGLSSRFLVDSKAALNAQDFPTRAYFQPDIQVDMSMAVAVVLDESGSMDTLRKDATRIMTALTEPFDGLDFPTMVLGFRNGWQAEAPVSAEDKGTYHRRHGVQYDIFKMFHERFKSIRWRFANTRANGGTPMSDGIQYALDALNYRDEAHRFLFVVTDGCPNGGHTEVINRQIRLAKQAGIHIVGVGMGYGAQYVQTLFPDNVYTTKMADFPRLLLAKLNELVDIRAPKRGRRMRKTG